MIATLSPLVGKLNRICRSALEAAAGACVARGHYAVEVEHLLIQLVERGAGDTREILGSFNVPTDRLLSELYGSVNRLKTGNTRMPSFSPRVPDLIEAAWVLASVDFGATEIRSGHLILALLANETPARHPRDFPHCFQEINVSQLRKNFAAIVAASDESDRDAPGRDAAPTGSTMLDQYTVDLTERARQGLLDPVLGREPEIRHIIDILMRRRQNNPILTGDAGVGKTAVVEGLALRVAAGDVPDPLKPISIRVLDLTLLQAGAGVKGEFENRLKSVVAEVASSLQPVVLFIDEAHTLIGAGGQAGQGDAANILKPALARGELRTIAATTWSEYKKYFEKDAALARRFQVVKVEEPTEEKAVAMLRGMVAALETHHGVRVLDEAVVDAVRLSSRFITGRQLPDKAVSVLDTACARVAMANGSVPSEIEDARVKLDCLKREIEILDRESATGGDFADRLAALRRETEEERNRLDEMEGRWERERSLVGGIHSIRDEIEKVRDVVGAADEVHRRTSRQRRELEALTGELERLQGGAPLVQPCVASATIAQVISGWTGIPVGKMLADEIQTVLSLKEKLARRVIGQDAALDAVSRRIRTSRANLTDPRRPVGVFLLVGPSGVGKTETALALADAMYGGERNLITINMSEFQEPHTVSLLKGSPPGYVGYGEGGVLTEAVRRNPYSVVLLDEIEKAHPDVMELFYQVFDKGTLEDGEGRLVDFKNTVILVTSNAASDKIVRLCSDPETRPTVDALVAAIRPELVAAFKPALLGRMVVVPYFPLAETELRRVARLQIERIADRFSRTYLGEFTYSDEVVEAVVARCRDLDSGARAIDHILTGTLLPELADECLSRTIAGVPVTRLEVGIGGDRRFEYRFA